MRRHGLTMSGLWAVYLTGAAGLAAQELEGHRLQYKFEPGQFIYYQVHDKGTTQTSIQSASVTAENASQVLKHFRVLTVNRDGHAILELVFDKVWMSARQVPGEPIVYSSESKQSPPPIYRDVHQSVGKPLARATVASNGRLVELKMLNGKDAPEELNASHNFLIEFPETPLRVGDSWRDVYAVEVRNREKLKVEIRMVRVWTLTGVKDGQAHIRFKTSFLTPVTDPFLLGQLIKHRPVGKVVFDLRRGQILSRDSSVDDAVVNAFGPRSLLKAEHRMAQRLVDPHRTAQGEKLDRP